MKKSFKDLVKNIGKHSTEQRRSLFKAYGFDMWLLFLSPPNIGEYKTATRLLERDVLVGTGNYQAGFELADLPDTFIKKLASFIAQDIKSFILRYQSYHPDLLHYSSRNIQILISRLIILISLVIRHPE